MKRLIELRREAGMRQSDLAEMMEVSRSAITMWERGRARPKLDSLERMADIFNVPVDYLLERDGDPLDDEAVPVRPAPKELELLEDIRSNPELRALLSTAQGATAEDIRKTIAIIKALKETS